jgi:hypothetical protein
MTLITIRRRTPRRPTAAHSSNRPMWAAALMTVLAGASAVGAQLVWLRAGGGLPPAVALGALFVPGPLAIVPLVSLGAPIACSWRCGLPGSPTHGSGSRFGRLARPGCWTAPARRRQVRRPASRGIRQRAQRSSTGWTRLQPVVRTIWPMSAGRPINPPRARLWRLDGHAILHVRQDRRDAPARDVDVSEARSERRYSTENCSLPDRIATAVGSSIHPRTQQPHKTSAESWCGSRFSSP